LLLRKILNSSPGRVSRIQKPKELEIFQKVQSIEFYGGIVAYHVVENLVEAANLIKNMEPADISDFRYAGKKSTSVLWPALFKKKTIKIDSGKAK
jgi:hypothetical protein